LVDINLFVSIVQTKLRDSVSVRALSLTNGAGWSVKKCLRNILARHSDSYGRVGAQIPAGAKA